MKEEEEGKSHISSEELLSMLISRFETCEKQIFLHHFFRSLSFFLSLSLSLNLQGRNVNFFKSKIDSTRQRERKREVREKLKRERERERVRAKLKRERREKEGVREKTFFVSKRRCQ